MYKGACGRKFYSCVFRWTMFWMLLWNANVIFIWCTNVKGGWVHSKISFENLFESTYQTSVGPLSNAESNNTKTTLSHTRPAFAILTTTYEAPPETHSVRRAHEALHKEPLWWPSSTRAHHTNSRDQRLHARPLGWNHYQCKGAHLEGGGLMHLQHSQCMQWKIMLCLKFEFMWVFHKTRSIR